MEQSERYRYKLAVYEKAVKSFSDSLEIDLKNYPEEIKEVIKNGQIQKFEYCTELTWKMLKLFLLDIHSIDAISPKDAVKKFFLLNLIRENDYELLIEMLDDRNKLSHIYKEEYFESIHSKLGNYSALMKLLLSILKTV